MNFQRSELKMVVDNSTLEIVKAAIVETLGIEDRADTLDASTPLFGSMPELDSFAVVALLTALEAKFGIEMDGSALTGEVFETVGSLATFIDENRATGSR